MNEHMNFSRKNKKKKKHPKNKKKKHNSLLNQPLRGRLHKADARPQRRGERLGALKFKETEK